MPESELPGASSRRRAACAEVFRHFRAVSRAAYGRAAVEAPPLAVSPVGSAAPRGGVVEAASTPAIIIPRSADNDP